MDASEFRHKLTGFAELILKVGLNLQPGQRLVILAGLEAVPLVREVAAQAYRDGCRLVTVFWYDEQLELVRLQNATRDAVDEFAHWNFAAIPQCLERGDAYLQIGARTPDLLKGQDPDLVALGGRAFELAYSPISNYQSLNRVNWNVVRAPTAGWAKRMFPEEETPAALDRLWAIIFDLCRLNEPDPPGAWQAHFQDLAGRCDFMNARQFRALRFLGPGTDLLVGLPEGHRWVGGLEVTQAGVPFAANLPTEEIYTLPHRARVDGIVTASRPLNNRGFLIEDFKLTFRDGKVVGVEARKGETELRNLIEADENAGRLGEVALVPHGSPISRTGMVFYDTLFDENAAHHIALGSAYKYNLTGGEKMSDEEFKMAGGNRSTIHVDFMIGSGQTDVFGIDASGASEKIMGAGEWVEE